MRHSCFVKNFSLPAAPREILSPLIQPPRRESPWWNARLLSLSCSPSLHLLVLTPRCSRPHLLASTLVFPRQARRLPAPLLPILPESPQPLHHRLRKSGSPPGRSCQSSSRQCP